MDKGFFVVLVKRRQAGENGAHWKAEPLHATPGWNKTVAPSMDLALRLQKEQYEERAAMNAPVPALVDAKSGPMASGQTVRFVAVGQRASRLA